MANDAIAQVPGIELYKDGINYNFKDAGCLRSLYALTISQQGFAPIEHVSAIEVSEGRDLNEFVFALVTIPLLGIGILLLLIWMLRPKTILRVRSNGEIFAIVILSKDYRKDALEMIETFRRLKHSLAMRKLKAS